MVLIKALNIHGTFLLSPVHSWKKCQHNFYINLNVICDYVIRKEASRLTKPVCSELWVIHFNDILAKYWKIFVSRKTLFYVNLINIFKIFCDIINLRVLIHYILHIEKFKLIKETLKNSWPLLDAYSAIYLLSSTLDFACNSFNFNVLLLDLSNCDFPLIIYNTAIHIVIRVNFKYALNL